MATLTADMKTFIENNLAWITTVDKDGNLDLGPKMSMFVLDDNHLAYHERTAGQHYRNLQDGSPLVVAVANLAEKKGYRFRGTVTLHTATTSMTLRSRSPRRRAPRSPPPSRCLRSPRSRTCPPAPPQARPSTRTDRRQVPVVGETDDRHVTRKARFGRCMPEPRLSGLSIPAFVQRCRLRPAAERRRRAGDGLMSADAVTMPPLRDEEPHAPHLARQ